MEPATEPPRLLPLQGVRVLELGTYYAAGLATAHLAGLGASVVAVSRPADTRGAGAEGRFRPAALASLSAEKRAVDLDLRKPADKLAFEQLVRESDVLVTNFSATTLEKLCLMSLASRARF